MNSSQRAAALRLADELDQLPLLPWCQPAQAAAILRELATETVQEPEPPLPAEIAPLLAEIATLRERLAPFTLLRAKGVVDADALYAAPQQRRPLTDEQIDAVTRAQWGQLLGSMMMAHRAYARAIEKAITGEPK